MSGAAAAGRFGDAGGTPAGVRLGHYGAHLLVAAIAGMVLLAVFPLPAGSVAAVLVPLSLFAVVITAWVLMRRHDRALCELCLRKMPLDAAAAAARYQRRLAIVHLGQDRRLVLAYLVVLLGSNGLLFLQTLWAQVVWALVQCSMVYLIRAHATHRRLQPWCPWCSDGGGGEESVDSPEPTPVGGTRV